MANLIYQPLQTAVTWKPATQSPTETWEVDAIANAAGRQGALHDFTTGSVARRFSWRAYTQCQATPTLGALIRMYWKSSDGSHPDNDDGTGDAAVSAEDKLRNLQYLGSIVVDEAAANIEFTKSGWLWMPQRYGAPVLWNASGATLTTDEAEHGFILTPWPDEVQ